MSTTATDDSLNPTPTNPTPTNPTPTNSTSTNPTLVIPTSTTMEFHRTISPYDLTAADNPGAVISHPLLKGTNYDEWTCGMKTALASRKIFGFLDVLRSNISHRDVAKDLWDHLKKRFSVTNRPQIQQLKAELACCKQRGLAIEAYFGKLSRIWDKQDREDDKVHQFLFGLDDSSFRTVRSSLVSRTPLQPMEEVYNIVRQEEDLVRQATQTSAEQLDVTAFAAHSHFRRDDKDMGVLCKHCNRPSHLSDSCYAVIRYPEWWGERPRTRTAHGRGHGGSVASSSAGRGRGVSYANAVQISAPATDHANSSVITDADRDGVAALFHAEWEGIKNLLNKRAPSAITDRLSGTSSVLSWILDTGASHHLTGRLEVLFDLKAMAPVMVILADGREHVSVLEGVVILGAGLILRYVYYVEGLCSDLISVGQLMDENRCVVQLADHFLVVQDRTSRTVIGAGKCEHGTFFFRNMEVDGSVTTRTKESYDLWHRRMGHPSAKLLVNFTMFQFQFL
ncbi:PREDICTED: uncharacterized protein LOC104757134 [Camelina sativa]|uniref:Uncharacterized protein LOC104757134 n=1 Tax=Camelina sativa TaxID=90675 RepID=A0ABM0WYW8_CAMSA|nr:PREDICTED: uncharacterized protein LOC104757134 [Camelina sativa]